MSVPRLIGWAAELVGVFTLVFWIANYIYPSMLISIWPWKLTPLTARVMCGWGLLISVGALVLYKDKRWSIWRYNIQSIVLW